jgi:hypothetical protein
LSRRSVRQLVSKLITSWSQHETQVATSANSWFRILSTQFEFRLHYLPLFIVFFIFSRQMRGSYATLKQTTTASFNVFINSHSSLPQHPKVHILWNRWPTIIRWSPIQWHLTQASALFTFEFLRYLAIACRLW